MLKVDPKERIKMNDIYMHQWIQIRLFVREPSSLLTSEEDTSKLGHHMDHSHTIP
jgi:hypothetical protein